jgi:pimeloyl-ACP methyl ester carboxylesterase
MDATARHISKYTAGYEKLYPSARILAITSTVLDLTLASEAAKSKRLAPLIEILYALPPDTKLLLHLFSNTGAIVTTRLLKTYREKMGRVLPITAAVMDSTPGKAKYETTIRAFSVSLPKNPILRVIGAILLRVFFWVYILRAVMSGKGDEVEQARKVLNDKSFFNVNTPRMYIYGVADPMVDFHFIEEHADEAERLDYKVDREKFLESGHCAHLLDDQDRYWATVQRLWKTVS